MPAFFRKALLFIILAELISLFSFLSSPFDIVSFWTLTTLFLIIGLHKLEWGLYLLLTELFIGSKGYLFSFEYSGTIISIRLAFFIIFLAVWLSQLVTNSQRPTKQLKEIWAENKYLVSSFLFLISWLLWSFLWALIRHNSFDNIFFDANGWLYFLLFIPFLNLIKSNDTIKRVITLLLASVTWTAIKTLTSLYLFSHSHIFYLKPFYKWLRDTGIGEITILPSGFSRIFFQSQIYVLIGIFVIGTFLVCYKLIKKEAKTIFHLPFIIFHSVFILLSTAVIVSLSRSFWVGLITGFMVLLFIIIKQKTTVKNILKLTSGLVATFIICLALIYGLVKIPPSAVGLSDVKERINYAGPAGSSRSQQLKPLLKEIVRHPLIGSGFGTTVTYQSEDPRIKNELNPKGWYTTYAFEWGYLDITLKLGLIGLGTYLWFIFSIMYTIFPFIIYHLSFIKNNQKLNDKWKMENGKSSTIELGLFLGLIALLTTNIFSPYLNHPLGIGYLILCAAIFSFLKNKMDYPTPLIRLKDEVN